MFAFVHDVFIESGLLVIELADVFLVLFKLGFIFAADNAHFANLLGFRVIILAGRMLMRS